MSGNWDQGCGRRTHPHLNEREQQQAADRAPLGPLVIHEIVREEGNRELERSFSGLAWSGLAAGLSIGFSFVMQAYIRAGLPDAPWARLVDGFGYCLGVPDRGARAAATVHRDDADRAGADADRADGDRCCWARCGFMRWCWRRNIIGTWVFGAISAQPGRFLAGSLRGDEPRSRRRRCRIRSGTRW